MEAVGRIGIVEDDADLRQSLADAVVRDTGLELVFVAGSVAEALTAIEASEIDLCLLDLGLPDGDGLNVLGAMRSAGGAKCLVLTVLGDRNSVVAAMAAGADGYLLKDTLAEQVCTSIKSTLAGEAPISPVAARYLLDMVRACSDAEPGTVLSGRELEVLRLFSRGLSYREAALALSISPHTIGDHVKAIYGKLKVHSRAEAIFEARQMGLIRPLD